MQNIQVKDLVNQIRSELIEIDTERLKEGRTALFMLEELELELKFNVLETNEVKSGFDIKLVSLGGKTDLKESTTHTVRLKYSLSKNDGVPVGGRAHASSEGKTTPDIDVL
jgi:hypothetical protein